MDPSAINDPFADRDDQTRTFIKPDPRGRAASRSNETTGIDVGTAEAAIPDVGLNPLVALANRLLLLVPQLRATRQVADPAALRTSLAQGIRDFAARAAAQGIAPERVMASRYVLCTMIDEAAADTPWGGSGVWGRHSLLAMFHNETEGGEKVFQLMARLAEKPAENRDLLELIYAAITLGFEGRYRVIENGRAQHENFEWHGRRKHPGKHQRPKFVLLERAMDFQKALLGNALPQDLLSTHVSDDV